MQVVVEVFIALVVLDMHKIGHIQKMCHSSTAVVQSGHSTDSTVVTVSPSLEVDDIPPMFQILQLHKFVRQLRLVVDSASPVTFVNSRSWKDLDKPKLQSTTKVLGAFEGQPIHLIGYFITEVSCEENYQKVTELQIYVSPNGINILGRDGLTKLNISISLDKFGTVATMESFTPKRLQEVLNVNDEIFKPELGHCVTIQAKLFL